MGLDSCRHMKAVSRSGVATSGRVAGDGCCIREGVRPRALSASKSGATRPLQSASFEARFSSFSGGLGWVWCFGCFSAVRWGWIGGPAWECPGVVIGRRRRRLSECVRVRRSRGRRGLPPGGEWKIGVMHSIGHPASYLREMGVRIRARHVRV